MKGMMPYQGSEGGLAEKLPVNEREAGDAGEVELLASVMTWANLENVNLPLIH
jgi:hypothetical protein